MRRARRDIVKRIRSLADVGGDPSMEEAMKDPVIAATVREFDGASMYLGIEDAIHSIADDVEALSAPVPVGGMILALFTLLVALVAMAVWEGLDAAAVFAVGLVAAGLLGATIQRSL